MSQLFQFADAVRRDPAVEAWMQAGDRELRAIAQRWFDVLRASGDDVHELMHDGYPTACVEDAAFAYVGAFKAHVNVGFFRGAELADPTGLLEGTGKLMRHVKLRPQEDVDARALTELIEAAYSDMKERVRREAAAQQVGEKIAALGNWRGATSVQRQETSAMPEHEKINYVEFPARDLEATKAFFREAFGWSFVDYGPDYSSFSNEGLDGGFFKSDLEAKTARGSALVVLYSGDLEGTEAKVVAAGGEILKPIFAFPGGRRFHFAEPSGNELAVWGDAVT